MDHAPTLSVLFPYQASATKNGGVEREKIAAWIIKRYRGLLTDFELCIGSPDFGKPFNRSQAINNAFRKAHSDILLIADLDVVMESHAIGQALTRIGEGGWGFTFTTFYTTNRKCVKKVLKKPPTSNFEELGIKAENCESVSDNTESCNLMISRSAFERTGGFDEDFIGWGYEDLAFITRAKHRLGDYFRIPDASAAHLWHPRPAVNNARVELVSKNMELYQTRYVDTDLDLLPRFI